MDDELPETMTKGFVVGFCLNYFQIGEFRIMFRAT